MSMSQKEAVVSFTLDALKATSFQSGKDVALTFLTSANLEHIKDQVYAGIMAGQIQYGKPLVSSEVRAYSRSVTMNHLKKAKELNGGIASASASTSQAVSRAPRIKKASITFNNIPKDLKENLDVLLGSGWEN
jgi:hypothetical protein